MFPLHNYFPLPKREHPQGALCPGSHGCSRPRVPEWRHGAGVAEAALEDPNPAHTPPTTAAFASRMIKSHLHAVIHPQICPAGAEPGGSNREGPEDASTSPAALAKHGQDGSSAGSC